MVLAGIVLAVKLLISLIWREAKWQWDAKEYGNFVIDLSYYESYDDEPGSLEEIDNPRHLCVDNAEEWQNVWE